MPRSRSLGCVSNRLRTLLLSGCLLFASISVDAQDAYEIIDSFYFPLIINRSYVGEIEVGFDTSYEPVYLKVADLYPHLSIRIQEQYTEPFRDDEWVTKETLRKNRIPVTYDPSQLIFEISVIPETARVIKLSLAKPPAAHYGRSVEPVDFSFYTNIYTEYSLNALYGDIDTDARFERLTLDPNITYRDWVMESRFTFTHDNESVLSYSSGTARLVRYRPDEHTRITIGDLHSQQISGGGAWGIFFEKNYAIGYARTTNNSHILPLILREPADVRIRLNDRSIFDDSLTQGQYDFTEFSLQPGVNTLEVIRKKYDSGEEVTDTMLIPFDNALLPKGDTEYSAGITIPSSVSFDDFRNDPLGNITMLGYMKAGISHRISGAYFFSIMRDSQIHRTTINLATLQGNYRLNSQATYGNSASYVSSDLSYTFFDRSTSRSFGVSGGFDTQNTSVSFSSTYSQGLFDNFGFNTQVRLNYDWKTEDINITPESTIRHRLNISSTASLVTQMTVRWLPNDFNVRGSMYLSTSFNNNRITASVRQTGDFTIGEEDSTFNTIMRASYRPKTDSPMGAVTMSLTDFSSSNLLPNTFNLGTSFENRYFTSGLSQTARFDQETIRFTLGLSTALAYADSTIALTRPISNSFALVRTEGMLEGYPITVNSGSGRQSPVTNASGLAVLGNLTAFQTTSLVLDPWDLPSEIIFTDDQFRLTTGYKQAFIIRPGAEGRVFLTGRIFLDTDKPLMYGFGDIIAHTETEEEPQFIFTDDAGRFFAYELRPGRYTLTLYLSDRIELIEIIIPPDLIGAASVGDIILSIPPEDTHTVIESEEYRDLFLTGKIMVDQQTPGRFLSGLVSSETQELSFTSDARGNFIVYDITPGIYDLSVFYNMDVERFTIEFPDIMQGGATLGTIYLIEAFVSDQEGTIETRAPLSGRIQFSDGVPYAHGYGEVYCEADEMSELVHFITDDQGRFIIYDVRSGVYILTLSHGNRHYHLRLIVPDDITPTGMTTGIIELPFASTDVDSTIRRFPAYHETDDAADSEDTQPATLTGRFMFDTDTPGAYISGILATQERSIEFTTDSQGRFSLSNLLPGMHTMTVLYGSSRESFAIDMPAGNAGTMTTNTIYLAENMQGHSENYAYSEISVFGTVRYHDGTPYAGRIGEAVRIDHEFTQTHFFITDNQGQFVITGLYPGEFLFSFEQGGRHLRHTEKFANADLDSGEAFITIHLPPAGRIE